LIGLNGNTNSGQTLTLGQYIKLLTVATVSASQVNGAGNACSAVAVMKWVMVIALSARFGPFINGVTGLRTWLRMSGKT